MTYFRKFSELLYQSPLESRNSTYDYVRVKNIFRRAKIREDFFRSSVTFNKYNIIGEERPDQISKKFYGSPEYDWVVLLSNNIINLRNEWPLSDSEFNNYIQSKFTASELTSPHHYETTVTFDTRGKMIVPGGKIVDSNFSVTYFDEELQEVLNNQTIQGKSITINPVRSISVYEYEIQQNEKKRNIYILNPNYLQTIIDDLEEIMTYNLSSQFVDRRTKKGDNLRIISTV